MGLGKSSNFLNLGVCGSRIFVFEDFREMGQMGLVQKISNLRVHGIIAIEESRMIVSESEVSGIFSLDLCEGSNELVKRVGEKGID